MPDLACYSKNAIRSEQTVRSDCIPVGKPFGCRQNVHLPGLASMSVTKQCENCRKFVSTILK